MKHTINWKIFSILLSISVVSVACVFPYVVSIQGDLLRSIGKPMELIFFAQLVQSAILFAVLIYSGMFFTKKVGFTLPLLEAIVKKEDYKAILKRIALPSALIGAVVALLLYVADYLFMLAGVFITTHDTYAPVWQKLLASVYGGTTEEIIMRLFFVSFFAWISMKVFKRDRPTTLSIIVSIVLAAIIFGIGHLPITASITEINALVVTRAIVLNGIAGIIFGLLFWKKGLESAMIAHFTADIFLLTILPFIL